MSALRTFRVEVSSAGKVVSCTAVAGPLSEGNRVFFVEAVDEASARDLGRSAYNEYTKLAMREHRARLKANRLCRCGQPNDRHPTTRCSACVAKDVQYKERRRAKERGEAVPKLDRVTSLDQSRERSRTQLRIEVLREVRRKLVSESDAMETAQEITKRPRQELEVEIVSAPGARGGRT